MRRAILFKTLIDILFFFTLTGSLNAVIPRGLTTSSIEELSLIVKDKVNLILLLIPLFSIISYIFLIRGVYFLRKMARGFLSNRYYSDTIISNLRKSGKSLVRMGVLQISIGLVVFLYKILILYDAPKNKVELTFDLNSHYFLLLIIGLFFIIQSESLAKAKELEDENKLII